MKRYIIKPEFITLYGENAGPMTELTEEDVENFAEDWGKDVFDLKSQLIEIRESGYRPIHRFAGDPGWTELNSLIAEDSGINEPYCETEEDYKRAVKDGFIKYDGYYTTVYVDD